MKSAKPDFSKSYSTKIGKKLGLAWSFFTRTEVPGNYFKRIWTFEFKIGYTKLFYFHFVDFFKE